MIIADASPLIGLDRAGHLALLPGVFGELAAPPAVVAEFGRRPGWLRDIRVGHPAGLSLLRALRFGPGESEALAIALEHPGSTVLLDERRARQFARVHDVEVIGTAGVVLRAKQQGLLGAVRPVLDDLLATGFRLSESLYRGVLARSGEG